jgi:hypothetical protein
VKRAWPFIYAAILFGMIGGLNVITADDHQYSRLAESFLDGKLFLLPRPLNSWADMPRSGSITIPCSAHCPLF